jgi:phosphate starvation-inducible PhoH-like protein
METDVQKEEKMGEVTDLLIPVVDPGFIEKLFGNYEENAKIIEKTLDINLRVGDGEIRIVGVLDAIRIGERTLRHLMETTKQKAPIRAQEVRYAIHLSMQKGEVDPKVLLHEVVTRTYSGRGIKPKTIGQKTYLQSIQDHDVVFGIGPAGTGKTYLAVASAVQAFRNNEVHKIILTRPAVEAGERLGFLPGDLQDKVDPYLRPLNDALFEIVGPDNILKYKEKGLIEIAPLAYMRGRTLDNAFVILDEAQNTTPEQMKMFLTRLGFGSKAIITGDITQIDLPEKKKSGLKQAIPILEQVKGIDFVFFSKHDIVRHKLVQRIIEAYEDYGSK